MEHENSNLIINFKRKSKFHSDICLVNKIKSYSNFNSRDKIDININNNNQQMIHNSSVHENSSSDSLKLKKFSKNNLERNNSSSSRVILIDEGRSYL